MSLASARLACLACFAPSLVCALALALAPDFRKCLSVFRTLLPLLFAPWLSAPISARVSHHTFLQHAFHCMIQLCDVRSLFASCTYLACLRLHMSVFLLLARFSALSMLRRVGMSIHARLGMWRRQVRSRRRRAVVRNAQRCLCAYLCLRLRLSCRDALSSLLVSIWFVLASSESRPLRLCFRL